MASVIRYWRRRCAVSGNLPKCQWRLATRARARYPRRFSRGETAKRQKGEREKGGRRSAKSADETPTATRQTSAETCRREASGFWLRVSSFELNRLRILDFRSADFSDTQHATSNDECKMMNDETITHHSSLLALTLAHLI
jgi:hypothetical protein